MKILCVCGARPNFMKIAPIVDAFSKAGIDRAIVHTGQHYSPEMSRNFFDQLEIPKPDVNLEAGPGSHAFQTAEIIRRFEPVVIDQKPDAVLVVGDVNSTIACGLTAVKLGIKLIHVEAGLRSFDKAMPEEINRILTDSISDMLFVSEPSGIENLRREGRPEEAVFLAGNVMIDTLFKRLSKAGNSDILKRLGLKEKEFLTLTLHRPENVDSRESLLKAAELIERASEQLKIVLPLHPRTKRAFKQAGLEERITGIENLVICPPLNYIDFLRLLSTNACALTDSGGVQEETTALGIPCITLRKNTERPITITEGTNTLTGLNPEKAASQIKKLSENNFKAEGRCPKLWDGKAAERIAAEVIKTLA
ncbi:UDP-2,3-diacetamido-2,3-dideoxy-D-glucuronate 2-epimerase [Sedimentisphaera cyanobacteriorum]|uniref:UDP-2,3-diacetamido-2,3-dideoxy-D-glucuronate 2-epimerase n=1 Tax=Sedimentisphaera cyanobacteriorum TaxID=1940790 RepID=A0A1Q2HRF4_9BACT|nr:UDP-N-acetylglucosamine 2-epimerase (non-hydrolyzing) [Sedimentisphaera cyanobacteriorum]AQQ09980.1 UDP-2,3-diacetamido-2,3-dideoxy-D-glucuronate 2-epimerase [Sedimentisphaera cyanobacteriorum]